MERSQAKTDDDPEAGIHRSRGSLELRVHIPSAAPDAERPTHLDGMAPRGEMRCVIDRPRVQPTGVPRFPRRGWRHMSTPLRLAPRDLHGSNIAAHRRTAASPSCAPAVLHSAHCGSASHRPEGLVEAMLHIAARRALPCFAGSVGGRTTEHPTPGTDPLSRTVLSGEPGQGARSPWVVRPTSATVQEYVAAFHLMLALMCLDSQRASAIGDLGGALGAWAVPSRDPVTP